VNPIFVILLASLGADAGSNPDAGLPPWAPRLKPAGLEDAASYVLRERGEGYVWENSQFEARVGRDGVVTFKDKRHYGTFDLTDEIMRMLGQDPYGLEKTRFLSATFEFRINLAIEARKIDVKKALDRLPSYLDDLWGDDRYTPQERRRILYELWSEIDRTPDGDRAARIIEDFVRHHLPCGSPDAYTKSELEAFAKSHPERRFAPIDECAGNPAPVGGTRCPI